MPDASGHLSGFFNIVSPYSGQGDMKTPFPFTELQNSSLLSPNFYFLRKRSDYYG
jgi:hypothetical protein